MEDVSRIPDSTLQILPCSPSSPRTPAEPQGQDSKMEVRDVNLDNHKAAEEQLSKRGKDQKGEGKRGKMCVYNSQG